MSQSGKIAHSLGRALAAGGLFCALVGSHGCRRGGFFLAMNADGAPQTSDAQADARGGPDGRVVTDGGADAGDSSGVPNALIVTGRLVIDTTPVLEREGEAPHGVRTLATGDIQGDDLTVISSAGLAPCDEVLLIALQAHPGQPTHPKVGAYEIHRIAEVISPTEVRLRRTVGQLGGVGSGELVVALQRIPYWDRVTVTADGVMTAGPWDGQGGGVLAFRTQQLEVLDGGVITTSGLGYRGGSGATEGVGGPSGESSDGFRGAGGAAGDFQGTEGGGSGDLATTETLSQGTRGGGGGGGGDSGRTDDGAGGGGGGGHGGGGGGGGGGSWYDVNRGRAGGNGGTTGVPGGGGGEGTCAGANAGESAKNGNSMGGANCLLSGDPGSGPLTGFAGAAAWGGGGACSSGGGGGGGGLYGTPDLSSLFFGSGGGAGGSSATNAEPSGSGGAGGGIILVLVEERLHVAQGGRIEADGSPGTTSGWESGQGGGGAGGSVLLLAGEAVLEGLVSAVGSPSGAEYGHGGRGGGGGVGRIAIWAPLIEGTTNPPAHSPSDWSGHPAALARGPCLP